VAGVQQLAISLMSDRCQTIRVLLIDDHQMVSQSLRMILDQEPDIEVVATASRVTDGVAAADAHRPDVILLDYYLPDGDGISAAVQIRLNDPSAKIVLLTGSDDPYAFGRAVAAGCVGYLDKVGCLEDLAPMVRAAAAGQVVLSADHLVKLVPGRGPTALTKREREILHLVAEGGTNKAIAEQLYLSVHTVRTHVQAILEKLGAHSKLEAVAIAKRRRLLG
jgi:DNA-binding NarL/FixJ family response regulator